MRLRLSTYRNDTAVYKFAHMSFGCTYCSVVSDLLNVRFEMCAFLCGNVL